MSNRTLTASACTASWIDPRLYGINIFDRKLAEVDKQPLPAHISNSQVANDARTEKGYRFANFIEASVTVDAAGRITSGQFAGSSKQYMSVSFAGSMPVDVGLSREVTTSMKSARFRQIVCSRTAAHEMIGENVGGAAGLFGGALLGAPLGPFGMLALGVGGLLLGRPAGSAAAREGAKAVGITFPPIWSDLELTINADGSTFTRLRRYSLFPSLYLYEMTGSTAAPSGKLQRTKAYDGVPNLERWLKTGWKMARTDDNGTAVEGYPFYPARQR
jgi:hypothetical protein